MTTTLKIAKWRERHAKAKWYRRIEWPVLASLLACVGFFVVGAIIGAWLLGWL